MKPGEMTSGDALLIVDVQLDFCPGGALPIPDGDRVVPILNDWIAVAERAALPVFASRDWHPAGHPSFQEEGGTWPPHCIQDSEGASFHPDLRLPHATVKVTKGTRFDQDQYSAFDQTGLDRRLLRDNIHRLWVGGLAQDVCVCATVLDARKHDFEVGLIPGGSLPVTREGGIEALQKMKQSGATLAEEPR